MKKHHYTPEQDDFIRSNWPSCVNIEYFTKRFNKMFSTDLPYSRLRDHATGKLALKKSRRAIREQRKVAIRQCLERRGPNFNERMRARALSGTYFGGKHYSGKGRRRPDAAEIARRITPESRAQAHETRRKTVRSDRLRLKWGIEQRTRLRLVSRPGWESVVRSYLRKRYGYVIYPYDDTIYYTPQTTRLEKTEAHYISRGLTFLPLPE